MCLQTSPLAGLFCVAARMKSLMRTGHDLPNVLGYMFQYVVDTSKLSVSSKTHAYSIHVSMII